MSLVFKQVFVFQQAVVGAVKQTILIYLFRQQRRPASYNINHNDTNYSLGKCALLVKETTACTYSEEVKKKYLHQIKLEIG